LKKVVLELQISIKCQEKTVKSQAPVDAQQQPLKQQPQQQPQQKQQPQQSQQSSNTGRIIQPSPNPTTKVIPTVYRILQRLFLFLCVFY
jgi:hypothetical protein